MTWFKNNVPMVAAGIVLAGAFGYRVHRAAVFAHPPAPIAEASTVMVQSSTTPAWLEQLVATVTARVLGVAAAFPADDEPAVTLPTPSPPSAVWVPIVTHHGTRWGWRTDTSPMGLYDVTPTVLARQLQYLHDHGYSSISFDQLAQALAGNIQLPEKPIIISFDDGWVSQYREAFPLLQRYGLTATFFVYTEKIGQHANFFTWDQLREMAAAGMEIGSHTLTHPNLNRISDIAELKRQIAESKLVLEEQLDQPVTALAYPYGLYNDRVVAMVQAAGYTTARGVSFGTTHAAADRFTLNAMTAPRTLNAFIRVLERKPVRPPSGRH